MGRTNRQKSSDRRPEAGAEEDRLVWPSIIIPSDNVKG